PWVWRARFWGHEPQTDIALLERGFHIAYCDVADLFGAPIAVKRWNQFYALMRERGFSSRPALEGMSRGGLIVYNWAAQNPDKVACVYADAPVLDLKSWPLNRKDEELNKSLFKAYGFNSIAEVEAFKGNPVDLCKTLASAGFPMLHVCGEVDDVVPVSENTNVFEKRIKDNNGNIRVIRKADVNHHPHSLDNPTEIVRFITEATNTAFTITDKSVPGNEFRSAAGWTEGADWYANHKEISSVLASEQVDLLLVGNSITQGFGGDRSIVTYKPGKKHLDAVLQNKKWQAAGISGDKSQNIIYRLENGNYNAATPKVVTLTIGINNLTSGNSPKETFIGIKKCIETAQRVLPNSKIVVFGVLPAGKEKNADLRIKIDEVNKMLSDYTSENKEFQYMNLDDVFVDSGGRLKTSLYAPDNLHLSGNGYAAWSKIIASLMD
ncbi:MAG: GDSL-type esterase/lipase family protein, partial [Tannerellaceae bacterium]